MIYWLGFILLHSFSARADIVNDILNVTLRSPTGDSANHINVALETVLEFNQKDQRSDIQLINNVQKFLDKVKYAITPSTTTTETTTTKESVSKKYKHKKQQSGNAFEERDHEGLNKHKKKHKRYHKKQNLNVESGGLSDDTARNIAKKHEEIQEIKHQLVGKKKEKHRFKKVQSRHDKLKNTARITNNKLDNIETYSGKQFKKSKNKNSHPRSASKYFANLAETLRSLSDNDLQTIIETADDEIRRFSCSTCNVEDDKLIRRSMSQGLDALRRTPPHTIRDFLQKLAEITQPENNSILRKLSGTVNRFFGEIEQILAHTKPKTDNQMKRISSELKAFLRSTMTKFLGASVINGLQINPHMQPAKKSLVDIVRHAIRTMIFDNYSSLDPQKKNWIKAKLRYLLKEKKLAPQPMQQEINEIGQENFASKIITGLKNWLQSLLPFQGNTNTKTTEKVKEETTTRRHFAFKLDEDETHKPNDVRQTENKKEKDLAETNENSRVEEQVNYDSDKTFTNPPKLVAVVGKKDAINKLMKKKSKKIKNKKVGKYKNGKKDKDLVAKLKRQQKNEYKYEIDKKWKEKQIKAEKLLMQKQVHKIKPKKHKMKTSVRDYIDEIDSEKENVIDEDGSSSSKDGTYLSRQEEKGIDTLRSRSQFGYSSQWNRRLNPNNSLKQKPNTHEDGISIEITKTTKNNTKVKKNTDILIPKNFDYIGRQINHTYFNIASDTNNAKTINNSYHNISGMYVPQVMRTSVVKPSIDIIDVLGNNPLPPIQYELSNIGHKPKIAENSSISVRRSYLSTLFTTKESYYSNKVSTLPSNDHNLVESRSSSPSYVEEEMSTRKLQSQQPEKNNNKLVSDALLENISELEENFARYQQIVQNETNNDAVDDIKDSKVSKNDNITSTTAKRQTMPSTVDVLKRNHQEELMNDKVKLNATNSDVTEDKKTTSGRRQEYEDSDLY